MRRRRLLAATLAGAILAGAGVSPAMAAEHEAAGEDPVRAAEYWLEDYGITDAWQTTRGAGVRIAIIDTGVGRGPAEFNGAVVGGTDVSGMGTDDGRTPVETTRTGYSVRTWPGRDFEYSAVSDVAEHELDDFVARWRAGALAN